MGKVPLVIRGPANHLSRRYRQDGSAPRGVAIACRGEKSSYSPATLANQPERTRPSRPGKSLLWDQRGGKP